MLKSMPEIKQSITNLREINQWILDGTYLNEAQFEIMHPSLYEELNYVTHIQLMNIIMNYDRYTKYLEQSIKEEMKC